MDTPTPTPDNLLPRTNFGPHLIHESGNVQAQHVSIGNSIAIGRERGEVRIPEDPYLSQQHAIVEQAGDRFVVRDCGSTNGTFVQVRPSIELRPGDEILIGGQLFRVVI